VWPSRIGAANGIKHLEVSIERGEAKETAEDIIDVRAKERGGSPRGLLGQDLGNPSEGGI
jgi:hypothetical protein